MKFLFVSTLNCNLNCVSCVDSRYNDGLFISPEIIENTEANDGDISIITGGEPTLNPQINALIAASISKFKTTVLCTNLTDISWHKQFIPGLEISTSIDGPREIHNLLRGRYDDVVVNIITLRSLGYNVTINFCTHPDNILHWRSVYKLSRELGCKFSAVMPIPFTDYGDKIQREIKALIYHCDKKDTIYKSYLSYIGLQDYCPGGKAFKVISPDGKEYKCFKCMYAKDNAIVCDYSCCQP